jgi:AcrR family transcriptional regulator
MATQLTRERIVATAIAIADRDGFEATTLRRIAGELGVHVTSLYNHIPTRDAVTDAMVERLVEDAELPTAVDGWEEWVRTFVHAIGAVASAHPGAFAALERRPVQGARAAASFEVALAAFAETGLPPDLAYGAVKTTALLALAIGAERSLQSVGRAPETNLAELPPDAFPHLHAAGATASEEQAWAFAVEALVAGLRAEIRRARPRSVRRTAREPG